MKRSIPNNVIRMLFLGLLLYALPTHSQVINPRTVPQQWEIGVGDPYIFKFRGKFYLYCSTRSNRVGVKCWSSWDLTNWAYEGLCADTSISIKNGAYAPEVIYWNGTFYMYTSPAGQGHYILTATNPTGPFQVVTGNLQHSIDGSVFIDDNAQMYFTNAGENGIRGSTMSGPLSINTINNDIIGTSLGGWTEASTMFKRNGLYYMVYTGNHVYSRGYRVHYATATTPFGTYTPGPNNPIVLNTEGNFYGLGHSTNVIGPDLDTWYIAYHNYVGTVNGTPNVRYFNIDPVGFNGERMQVFGPTNWTQPAPVLPAFYDRFDRTAIGANWTNVNGGGHWSIYNQELMYQDDKVSQQWFRQVSASNTAANYTAEFNMKEVGRGGDGARFGAVFSYVDENTFGSALLSSFNNTLETDIKVNGVSIGVQSVALPTGWNHSKWRVVRVEKEGTSFRIYIDGMLKATRTANIATGGKIGVTTYYDHADFGYTAFSNKINGSGVFNLYKPIPGTIAAVHYNEGGEGVGYHDLTTVNTGGKYRYDNVDIRDCEEGGQNIGWNQTGEWYQYNVNIQSARPYHLGLRYSTSYTACKLRVYCDGVAVSGIVSIPATGGFTIWRTAIIKNLNLPAGNHTIRLETVEGEFDFATLKFESGTTEVASGADNFDSGFSSAWNYSNGNWSITSGRATTVSGNYAKRTMGNVAWVDYTVEADVQVPASGNGGLIFRVRNPADQQDNLSQALSSNYLQGYYAGVETGGIVLGRHNYNWTTLEYKTQALTAGQTYKLRAVLNGDNIKIYLNNMTTPVIDFTDPNPIISGKAGLRSHNAAMAFDNFLITANTGSLLVWGK